MKNYTTVTVGIPAFNEENNIKIVLRSILAQKHTNHILKQILVMSDASTDKTVSIANSFKNKKIKVINGSKRLGLNMTKNKILKMSTSDVLVLVDADVILLGKDFLNRMIQPITKDRSIGIVGADVISAKPQTLFEKIIYDSHIFKYSFYKKIKNGNNIYMCHGRSCAFVKSLYKNLDIPTYAADDAYAYLFCIKKGFKFKFAAGAKVIFRSPTTLFDHIKQSKRFFFKKSKMTNYFDAQVVKREYSIPKSLFIKSAANSLITKPISTIIYLTLASGISLFFSTISNEKPYWDPSVSTKTFS